MDSRISNKLDDIDALETYILSINKHSPAIFGRLMENLGTTRKSLYGLVTRICKEDELVKFKLFREYSRYCDFNYSLLTTKNLYSSEYVDVIEKFLKDYRFINKFDANKEAYELTLETMGKVKSNLNCAEDNKIIQYRINGVNSLLEEFSKTYKHRKNKKIVKQDIESSDIEKTE